MYVYLSFYKNNVCVLKNNSSLLLYLYSKNYYCIFTIYKKSIITIKVDRILGVDNVLLKFKQLESQKKFDCFIKQFNVYNYFKIKFAGKGYKIKKYPNKGINLIFNRAHRTHMYYNHVICRRIKKYKIYIRCVIFYKEIVDALVNVRKVNIFTKRGLRITRRLLQRKKGKK